MQVSCHSIARTGRPHQETALPSKIVSTSVDSAEMDLLRSVMHLLLSCKWYSGGSCPAGEAKNDFAKSAALKISPHFLDAEFLVIVMTYVSVPMFAGLFLS